MLEPQGPEPHKIWEQANAGEVVGEGTVPADDGDGQTQDAEVEELLDLARHSFRAAEAQGSQHDSSADGDVHQNGDRKQYHAG